MNYDLEYWNNYYSLEENKIPWTTEEPDENLKSINLENFRSALDIGCGNGVNSAYLANENLKTTGIDISDLAIEICKSKFQNTNLSFKNIDILNGSLNQTFDLIYDRGCFHCFDHEHERLKFVESVKNHMHADSIWMSIIGNTDSIHTTSRPPKRSLNEIVSSIDPYLKIISIETTFIETNVHRITDKIPTINGKLSAYRVISKKRN